MAGPVVKVTAAPKQKGWMTVVVQDAATRAPIPGALIEVIPTTAPPDGTAAGAAPDPASTTAPAAASPTVAADSSTPSPAGASGEGGIVTGHDGTWRSRNPADRNDSRDPLSAGTGAGKNNVPQWYVVWVTHPGYGVPDPTSGTPPTVVQGQSVTNVALSPTSASGGLKVTVLLSQALVCAKITVKDDQGNAVVGAKVLIQAEPAPSDGSAAPGRTMPTATWPTDPLPQSPHAPAAVAIPTGAGDELTRTDVNGVCQAWFQPLGTPGGVWRVFVQKPGYGPVSATTGGDATATFDLTQAPTSGQYVVDVKMTNVWGKLTCSTISIGALAFPAWYKEFIKPYTSQGKNQPPALGWPPASGFPGIGDFPIALSSPGGNYAFASISNPAGFKSMFDAPSNFRSATLTVNEFIALFLIFMNEMGGGFTPDVGETDGAKNLAYTLKYCMETTIPGSNPTIHKASFNARAKVPAGQKAPAPDPVNDIVLAGDRLKFLKTSPPSWFDQSLLADVTVDDAFVTAWNGEVYPAPPPGSGLEKAARECDFYKCRGHGCVQLTFRSAYVRHAYNAIASVDGGFTSIDNVSADTWEGYMHNPAVYYPMIRSYLTTTVDSQIKAANRDQWFGFGRALGGGSPYGWCFEWRARVLLAGLQRDEVAVGPVRFT